MGNLIFYCSGGLGNRLNPLLNIKGIFDNELYLVWPQTIRLMCDFHDIFENENIKIMGFDDITKLDDVVNFHGSAGGLVASQHERDVNGNTQLFDISRKYNPKPINTFNPNNLPHKNTIVFYNNFVGNINNDVVIENFNKLIPKKGVTDKINSLINELGVDKSVIGIHARGTDFVNERIEKYYSIIDTELKNNKDQKIFLCSDDPNWESSIKDRYPNNVIIRGVKDSVYKLNTGQSFTNNVMTPLEAIIDAYIDIVLLSKTTFKHFNPISSFGRLINILQHG